MGNQAENYIYSRVKKRTETDIIKENIPKLK